MRFAGVSLLLLAAAFGTNARANDSTAELGAGGLQLTVNSGITMKSEDLKISVAGIDIAYAFENTGDTPITTLVAFPLPMLRAGDPDIADALPREGDPLNFVGFTVQVDGKTVTPDVEQRASILGIDITDRLKADGIPLNPYVQHKARTALARVPKDKRAFYVSHGLAVWSDDEPLSVQWDVATTFFWQQTFPAKGVVKVQHHYVPVSGSGLLTAAADPATGETLARRHCLQAAALDQLRTTAAPAGALRRASVEYVLRTGANWAGPIGRFRLTIEKPSADTVMAVCAPGLLVPASPTVSVFEAMDFTPTSDLEILFLHPDRDQAVQERVGGERPGPAR
ncbi:DUF4424 family protein [Xanthobacter oligotrophicus]|uniref:DUF4424 family protein n=1 Tax=Xanthobacter oligotrophicus TaxID=2607286 RepID=UPI00165DC244|nr:DUF4424 family protein [Xanthobacter oligotrophicus]MCG5233968.1 DUF4424 domain-containing protein [Xanthobacter oligotrophicus]